MLDYSYWALCSAGIITIISYSTGREKYKTTREWPTEKKKKINRPITLLYVAEQPQKWELRLIFAQSSSGRHRRVQQFKSSSDDWRHGLNLMANQLPKQSWLHEFCTKRNLRGEIMEDLLLMDMDFDMMRMESRRPKGLSCHWRLFDLTVERIHWANSSGFAWRQSLARHQGDLLDVKCLSF